MAINFPNSPVAGNTYEYLDIQYIYRMSGATGWWAVNTPAFVGVATPTEINEGTNNEKFVSPQGLNASKYVREDEVSGETTLSANGLERLRASNTGTHLTGQLVLDGEVVKDGFNVPVVIDSGTAINRAYRVWSDGMYEEWGIVETGDRKSPITHSWLVAPIKLGNHSLTVTCIGTLAKGSTVPTVEANTFKVTVNNGAVPTVAYYLRAV